MSGHGSVDVHMLTGAYALDALEDNERVEFERHLSGCEPCTHEVAELRETAARLGAAAASEPPTRLRATVLSRITEVRQEPPAVFTARRRRWGGRSTLPLRLSAAAAAILLVVSTVLGVLLVQERQAVEDSRQRAETVGSLLRADDARLVRLSGDGARMTLAMSREQDRMLVFAENLPPAPARHDYQAWTMGDHTNSAGLLEPNDGDVFLEVRGIDSADEFGITIEPDGGSDQPTTEPVMLFELS